MNKEDQLKRQQQISAILDGDYDEPALDAFMQDLKRDPEADAECVQRYQMIGDGLRDDLNQASFMDISSAVHRAIDQESDYQVLESTAESTKVPQPWINFSAWTRPLAGLAIAASVAMVRVVSFRSIETDAVNNLDQQVAAAKPESRKSTVTPVNPVIANQIRLVSTAESKTKAQLQAQQLSDYMIRHSDSAGQSTMQGMMPFVRVVGFESPQQK